MGISSTVILFGLCFVGLFILLVREVYDLNRTLDESKESNIRFHQKMSEKLADVEIEKMYLENKISELEETLSLWQGRSRKLHKQVDFLTNAGKEFEDETTRESKVKYRRAS